MDSRPGLGGPVISGAYARVVFEYQQERKGFWHEPEGRGTSEAIALETWARVAHDVLEETATAYHRTISEAELAERLMAESHVRTARPHDKWIAKVLTPLAHLHFRDDYPPLTALVVDERGWVGERYDDVMRAADKLPILEPAAREKHAASARLDCYQWAGSAPEDGGVPAAVPTASGRVRAPRATSAGATRAPRAPAEPKVPREPKVAAPRKVAITDRTFNVCPRCFMAIPATGLCDNCD